MLHPMVNVRAAQISWLEPFNKGSPMLFGGERVIAAYPEL
jgi:hypothetical protein